MEVEAPWLDTKTMELWLKTPVIDIKSEESSLNGDNYLSTMKYLKVTTKDGGIYPMIVKTRIEVGTTAEVFRDSNIFRKEREMYQRTLPKLYELLRKASPETFEEFAPKCYYACKTFLVMEDLSAAGFKMQNRRLGLDLDQCLLVMRTLAKYHAASAVLHEQEPGVFEKFSESFFNEPCVLGPMGNLTRGFAHTLADELESWPVEWQHFVPKLRNIADDLIKYITANTMRRDSDFNVLIHGDLWTNNMMMKGKVSGIRFVDFQLAHFTSPAIDIIYFIVSSAILEVKLKHMDKLIQEYHSTLSVTLTALGYQKKIMTLEELHAEIKRKSLYGFFTLVAPYSVMQSDPAHNFSFDDCLKSGYTPGPKMFGDDYKEAAKFFLQIFDRAGVFEKAP